MRSQPHPARACFARRTCAALLVCLVIGAPTRAVADDRWQAIHQEMRDALAALSHEEFGAPMGGAGAVVDIPDGGTVPSPWMIVVGFTGGLEGRESSKSGVVAMRTRLGEHIGERPEVVPLTFNNFHWRQAADDVVDLVERARHEYPDAPQVQPLIVVYGHSWGAGSIAKFAREIRKEDLEIALAIYIDAFTLRNPRLPDNIRYAVNFYQRGGILRGLPFRGKRKLLPEDPEATRVLGEYRIAPRTDRWGWSWNLLQPLLYRHHHRIGHDVRLQDYLVEITDLELQRLERRLVTPATRASLFDEVVILGASVSADEKAPSPGLLLSRHMGTADDRIHVFAAGGAPSEDHVWYLDNIASLRPSLIVALDLFYHDFKLSLFLPEATKRYIREYIARLHDTGAVVVIGNVPGLVLLRHGHVNRYLESLASEFPNLVLVDVETLLSDIDSGMALDTGGETVLLTRHQLFADRVHPSLLGSTVMANMLRDALRARFPERWPTGTRALPLPPLSP